MATKTVLQVDVQSNLAEQAKLSKSIKDDLQAAGQTRIPGPVMAARQGVSAAAKAESREYGIARSGMGTGAEGRDFAKQAQGLGGLVHVYATFAANLFAVSAAFGALSKAADTTNMIKGLDQLGAASGQALGSLSKRLSLAADGAISLRDAMTATAQASSAGMSSDAILRMGEVAKKASQALGVAMPDALSRISRGITKLEPELLDELGILVRVDTASQNYARSIGKSVSALSDFEKRQGFANAVLEQGEKKFGAIKIDANPYAKILASMENIAQVGLELVNKVLSPILSLLSQSPTALSTAMAGIAAVLLKQAIPALGAFRENALKAAEEARVLANIRSKAAAEAGVEGAKRGLTKESAARISAVKVQMAAELAIKDKLASAAEDAAEARADKTLASLKGKVGKKTTEIIESLRKASTDVGPKDIQTIQAQITRAESAGNKQRQADYQAVMDTVLESKKVHKSYADQVVSNDKKIADLEKQAAAEEAKRQTIKANYWSMEAAAQRDADKANKVAESRRIVAATGEITRTAGILAAYRSLNKEIASAKFAKTTEEGIKVPGLGPMEAGFTRVKGIIGIATTALSVFASTLSTIFFYVGIVVAAFNVLDGWFSKNSKEAAETSAAFDRLNSAAETVDNVMKDLETRDPLYRISSAAISAKAASLLELANASENTFKKIKAQVDKASWWDEFLDTVKADIGLGLLKESATGLALSIQSAFKVARPSDETNKALKQMKDLLGVDPTDLAALKTALNDTPEKFLDLGPKVNEILNQMAVNANNVASAGVALDEAFKKAGLTYDSIITSMLPTDNFAKLGFEFTNIGTEMANAFKDPIVAISKLAEISKDASKLRFFSPETAAELSKMSPQIQEAVSGISAYTDRIIQLKKEQAQLKKERSNLGSSTTNVTTLEAGITRTTADIKYLENASAALTTWVAPYLKRLKDEQSNVFIKGAELVATSIGIAYAKAALAVDKARVEGLGDTVAGIKEKARIDKAGIEIQIKQNQNSLYLAQTMEDLRFVEEERLILDKRKEAEAMPSGEQRSRSLNEVSSRMIALDIAKEYRTAVNPLAAIMKDLKGASPERQAAARMALPGAQLQAGAGGIRAGLVAEKSAIDIGAGYQVLTKESNIRKDILSTRAEELNTEKAALEYRAKNALYLTTELMLQKQNNAENIALNKIAQENEQYTLAIAKAQKTINEETVDSSAYRAAMDAKTELQTEFNRKQTKDEEARKQRSAQYVQDSIAGQKTLFDYQEATAKAISDSEMRSVSNKITMQSEYIDYLKQGNLLDESRLVTETSIIRKVQEQARSVTELTALKREYDKEQQDLQDKLAAQPAYSREAVDIANKIKANTEFYDRAKAGETALSTFRLDRIAKETEYNKLVATQAEQMQKMVDLTSSLSAVFGDLGTAIGNVGEAIMKMAASDEQYLLKKKQLQKDAEDPKKALEANAALKKLDKDRTKSQVNNITDVTSASKKMFKEHTDAYKVLNSIEKAAHAWKIASIVKEGVIKAQETLATMGITSMASARAALESVPAVLMKFVETMGWPGVVAGAAFVASLGLGGGGKVPLQAVDQGTLAGTGQQVGRDGQTIGTRAGGVLGDPKAEAKSLTDSIDGLSKVFFDNMGSTSSNLLKSLRGIQDNTYNTAKALGASGVIGGSNPFGAALESKAAFSTGIKVLDNILGSIFGGAQSKSVTGSGIMGSGTASEFAAGTKTLQGYTDIKTVTKGGWFSSDDISFSKETKPLQDATTKAIIGIFKNFNDTLLGTAEGLGQTKENIQNILDTEKLTLTVSSLGLTGTEFAQKLSAEVSVQLNTIAEKAYPFLSLYTKVGEESFQTATRLIKDSETVTFGLKMVGKALESGSLTAYKVAQQQKIIENFGGTADDFANAMTGYYNALFSEEEKAAFKTGTVQERLKELGQTGITTNDQLKALIATIDPTTKLYADLVKLVPAFDDAGKSAQNLIDKTQSLNLSLLQAQGKTAEALLLTRENTLKGMTPANAAIQEQIHLTEDANKTRSLSLTLMSLEGKTTEALSVSRNQELLALSESDRVIQKRINVLQDEAKIRNLDIAIYTALGNTEEALALTRKAELDALEDILKPSKRYLYALENEAKMKTKLTAAYDKEAAAIKGTITSLSNSIKTLKDYRTNLTSGAGSILTPAEKYAQAKAAFYQTSIAAQAVITATSTATEIAARDAAAGQMTTSADAFRTASEQMFAASGQYTVDFTSILDILATTSDSLTLQQTDAEKQLEALDASVSFLNLIATSTDTTATLLKQYLSLQDATTLAKQNAINAGSLAATSVPAFANGGLASGISLVGEVGPEVVDFKTPGRVYSNAASNDLFNTKELVAEIRSLRKEVAQLRSDQKEQTGHIIATNYDANNKNATAVSNATDEAFRQQEWKNRSQVKIA